MVAYLDLRLSNFLGEDLNHKSTVFKIKPLPFGESLLKVVGIRGNPLILLYPNNFLAKGYSDSKGRKYVIIQFQFKEHRKGWMTRWIIALISEYWYFDMSILSKIQVVLAIHTFFYRQVVLWQKAWVPRSTLAIVGNDECWENLFCLNFHY